jgi:formamidopyrimidine-DNA glycosylase
MPELPDITVYLEALSARVMGEPLAGIRLKSPFLLRTFEPRPMEVQGRRVKELRRMGKRIVFALEDDFFLVLHLMIAGRLQWKDKPQAPVTGIALAAFDFPKGTLLFTEASKKQRASLHIVKGESELEQFDRGGLEVLTSTPAEFASALRAENRTLKRALTDPTILSGIGNAYSDEILHRARLSPVTLTGKMDDETMARLHAATLEVLSEWTSRLRNEVGTGWPTKVTAFRPEMAVHGKFEQPCPDCGSPVQRIVYADNETNYCATCQTGGKLLADRSLSKLMKADWPKTLAELEDRKKNKI